MVTQLWPNLALDLNPNLKIQVGVKLNCSKSWSGARFALVFEG